MSSPRVLPTATAHCTVLVADVAGFCSPSRTNLNQVRIRAGLYGALRAAFDAAGISWDNCWREDRGDGALVLVPADVPKVLITERVPGALAWALRRHNRSHPAEEGIQLRLAVHAGEISYDAYGVTGSSINHAFRLVEAPLLKAVQAESASTLAIVSSSWIFDEVIRHSEPSGLDSYLPVIMDLRETIAHAWVRLME